MLPRLPPHALPGPALPLLQLQRVRAHGGRQRRRCAARYSHLRAQAAEQAALREELRPGVGHVALKLEGRLVSAVLSPLVYLKGGGGEGGTGSGVGHGALKLEGRHCSQPTR